MKTLLRSLIALFLLAIAVAAQATGNMVSKFALVIGNRDYVGHERALNNALHDADLMAQSLSQLGFTVTQASNLTRGQMLADVSAFAKRLPEGATAFVYYAGHGIQVAGNNYLIPVDMVPTSEQTLAIKAYPLKSLLEQLSLSRSAVNVVVLDACRDNPFQPRSPVRYRNFANLGLAPVQAPRGTLLAFSTSPGQLAADGKGKNSIYTASLAKALLEPSLELREIFEQAGGQVRKRTLDDQIPWYETSLNGKYYFLPPEGLTVVAGKSLQLAESGQSNFRFRSDRPSPDSVGIQWFSSLSSEEWNMIDREIQQRVKRLTADELPMLQHKAKSGNVMAQTTLGLVYREGVHRKVDVQSGKVTRYQSSNPKAVSWLAKAADGGFPVAQVELGEMYYSGHGLDRDLEMARYWFTKAEQVNYPRAKLNLLQLDFENGTVNSRPADLFKGLLESTLAPLRQQHRDRHLP
jgi:TPR repeat protein